MDLKIKVTVVVPVRNEEANLAACLGRLSRFDEVIVVDSDSEDGTIEVAEAHGAQVLHFRWDGCFPKKRNWVLLNHPLNNDFVLFLDADELVNDDFCNEVEKRVSENRFDGFWLNYANHFLDRRLKYGDPQRKLALFKVGKGLYERIEEDAWSDLDMEIHEHPILEGVVGEIVSRIDHRDDRGIAKFIERHKDYALWEARRTDHLKNSDSRLWDQLTNRQKTKYSNIEKWWFAWAYFLWAYVAKRGFLDGMPGFSYAFYKLWYFWTIRLLIKENEGQETK